MRPYLEITQKEMIRRASSSWAGTIHLSLSGSLGRLQTADKGAWEATKDWRPGRGLQEPEHRKAGPPGACPPAPLTCARVPPVQEVHAEAEETVRGRREWVEGLSLGGPPPLGFLSRDPTPLPHHPAWCVGSWS